jgi:hypothetical protein
MDYSKKLINKKLTDINHLLFFALFSKSKPCAFDVKMEILPIFNFRRYKTRPKLFLPTKDHSLTFRHKARPFN